MWLGSRVYSDCHLGVSVARPASDAQSDQEDRGVSRNKRMSEGEMATRFTSLLTSRGG